MSQEPETDITFYLGIIRDDAHEAELVEIARWLDWNKFSCTYSRVNKTALFTVCPYPDQKDNWARHPLYAKDGFVSYAADYIIHSLSRALGEKNAAPAE